MSRKFLDDNIELKMELNDGVGFDHLPSSDNHKFDPGHLCVDPISGIRFVNEGPNDRSCSLFVNDRYNSVTLYADFQKLPVLTAHATVNFTDTVTALAGTNAADAGATFQTANGNTGGVVLTTTTTANDQLIVIGNTNSMFGNVTCFPDGQIVYESQIVTDASITATIIWAGLKLTNTSVTATDNDQTFFRYQDTVDGGNWQIIDSTGGTDNVEDSGVTVAVSTPYLLQIRVGKDLKPRYYINGIHVGTGNVLGTGTLLKPFVGVQTTTTAAKKATVRYERVVIPRSPIV